MGNLTEVKDRNEWDDQNSVLVETKEYTTQEEISKPYKDVSESVSGSGGVDELDESMVETCRSQSGVVRENTREDEENIMTDRNMVEETYRYSGLDSE